MGHKTNNNNNNNKTAIHSNCFAVCKKINKGTHTHEITETFKEERRWYIHEPGLHKGV